jgi:hypothetical protein
MKSLLKFFLLLLAAVTVRAAADNYDVVTITVTNAPTTNGMTLVINGVTRTWTNNTVPAPSLLIATNLTAPGSATNLHNQIVGAKPSAVQFISRTDVTNIVLRSYPGQTLTVTAAGGWASITTDTLVATNAPFVQVPFHAFSSIARTQFANELVKGMTTNASSRFPTNAYALGNYIDVSARPQSLLGDTFGSGQITNSGLRDVAATNVTYISIGVMHGTNVTIYSGWISNVALVNVTSLSGVLTALTNGTLYHASVTNAPWMHATNVAGNNATFTTMLVTSGATITNLNAPGLGAFSQRIGDSSDATGEESIAIGHNANALTNYAISIGYSSASSEVGSIGIGATVLSTGESSLALGNGTTASATNAVAIGTEAVSGYARSVAIGAFSETTAENQIRLGTATEHVSIPGQLRAESQKDSTLLGTNTVNGSEIHVAGTYTALVTSPGNNTAIDISTNTVIEMSGAGGIVNICSFASRPAGLEFRVLFSGAVTNKIVENSGAEGDTTRRIYTGVGDVNLTNTYSWAKFRRISAGYLLLEHSN